MHIKRFRGASLPEALAEVKNSFGEDAVILSTRSAKGTSEVVAAIDFDVEEIESSLDYSDDFKKSLVDIKEELDELRYVFSKVVKDKAAQEVAELGGSAYQVYEELLKSGIHERLSRRLIKCAARATSDTPEIVKKRCKEMILEKTGVHKPFKGKEGPRILALVGPAGSGKSSTIAKIAGGLKKDLGANVGLISLPSSRPGALSSLREAARTFDMTLETPRNREALQRSLWGARDKDVILIDTPGVNPNDKAAIKRVAKMLKIGLPMETALVMSLAASDENHADTCKGFAEIAPDSLVFTRLDEVRRYGTIVNVSAKLKKPVAFLCDGQSIPDDIKLPSRKILGNLVLK
jgi:flagellar biosynthesis protein FlhF